MGNPPSITRSLQDTVSYKTIASYNAGGVPTYSSLQTASAKVWARYNVSTKSGGEELVVRHLVHTYTAIPKGAILWLPGEDTTDNEAGHIVDIVNQYDSLAVRGSQWTLYEILIEAQ